MKLLLVEDDRIVRIPVRDALAEAGFVVTACADGAEALRAVERESFALVLTDVRLPGVSGLELFRHVRRLQPDTLVLLMTAYADTSDAVTVMREGAADYLAKPFEMGELLLRLQRARQQVELEQRMRWGEGEGLASGRGRTIRGVAPATKRLLDRVEVAAASDVAVLITGETGTGKDLCARTIHERSRRAGRPFITVNCAAIPETLLEAELFGHEKGAFTGADRKRLGRFEVANGGTLLLDEVGELPLGSQVKLLRAVETRTFEPLGASRPVTVDVRILAATNRDLAAAVECGSFRRDLYYRLNVIDLHTPALRERRADLPLLVEEFLAEVSARQGCPVPLITPAAAAALVAHDYPGNVRELLHAIERAVAMARGGVIRLEHLPDDLTLASPATVEVSGSPHAGPMESLSAAVEEFERQYARRVLDKMGGHRGQTAAALGISRKTLWQLLRDGSE